MSQTFDVVVLGGGGSGLSAAVSAADNGARVVLLEKAPRLGGSTALSVGAMTAPCSSLQRAAGIEDSIDEFVADIQTTNGPLEPQENTVLRRLLAEESAATLEWLMGMGVRFLGPFPEPPHRHPRLHNILPNSRSYPAALARRARKLGVRIETSRPADELLVDTGRVVGVRSGEHRYLATRGVVIATGDFTASPEYLREHVSPEAGTTSPANPSNTGDGQRLGVSVGGKTVGFHSIFESLRYAPRRRPDLLKGMPASPAFSRFAAPFARNLPKPVFEFFAKGALVGWLAPNPGMYAAGGIQVDAATGRRIADETDGPALARGIGRLGDRSYLIVDSVVAARFSKGGEPIAAFPGVAQAYLEDVRRRRPDLITEAATLTDLAIRLDIPKLQETVDRWNSGVRAGRDPEFGRTELGAGILVGPFTALGPLESVAPLSNGGLAVDTDLRVLDTDDNPIPGLYAAGSAGQGGLLLLNNGLHLAWAHTSGRLAGRSVATA